MGNIGEEAENGEGGGLGDGWEQKVRRLEEGWKVGNGKKGRLKERGMVGNRKWGGWKRGWMVGNGKWGG